MNLKARGKAGVVLCGAIALGALWACPTVPPPAPKAVSLPSASVGGPTPAVADESALVAELESALRMGAAYLVGAVQEDGSFLYRVNTNPDVRVKRSYNMLRHAGTMYALAEYHERRPSPPVAAALKRADAFLHTRMAPIPERDAVAIWESDKRKEAKLGGAGLALVALVAQERAIPGSANVAELARLGRFVTYMQKPDGGFNSKYFTDAGGPNDGWTSLYYPGEAALGLLMLHELATDPAWLEGAVNALGYLATKRKGRARVEPDHWALIATGRLFAEHQGTHQGKEWPQDKGALRVHALQICESVLAADQVLDRKSPFYGAFDADGRTTPAATRLEGLLAVLPLLEGTYDAALKKRARTAIDAGIRYLLDVQIKEGKFAGGVQRSMSSTDKRATEIRIDYVQHAMSAWMGYLDLIRSEAP